MTKLSDLDKMNRPHEHSGHSQPLTAEDLVARMRLGKKTVSEIRMGETVIPVRVLSCDEANQVRRAAIAHATKVGGDETDKNLYIQKTTLQLASTLTSGSAPILTEKILSLLSYDEIGYLYEEFIKFMDTVNPALDQISPERFRELVDALKKNIVSTRDLSLLQLRAICTAYVDLIQQLETQT